MEEKSKKFDLYVVYQEKCIKLAKEKSELREKNKELEKIKNQSKGTKKEVDSGKENKKFKSK